MDALTCTTGQELSKALASIQQGTVALRVPPCRGAEQAILDKLNDAYEAGATALLLCADEITAQLYRDELAAGSAATGAFAAEGIVTVQDFALSIMADEAVQQACGRKRRLIDGNEVDVLLEDVKVTGIKPKRLREMLKFFYNSIANCANEDPSWLVSGEEQQVYSVLMENLEQRKSVLSFELSTMAYKGAEGCGKGAASFGASVVVADGFDHMSKSSQRLVRALAGELFIAIGGQSGASSPDEPYPNPEGFEELRQEDGVSVIELEPASRSIAVSVHTGETPAQEFAIIAQNVDTLLKQGARPGSILIGTPNRVWNGKIAQALAAMNVPCCIDGGRGKLKGDPRALDTAGEIMARAFFRLQLDQDDVTALRTWLGTGDWLLCSEPFLEMLAYAKTNDMSVLEAIRDLHANASKASDMVLFYKVDARLSVLDELNAAYASGTKDAIIAAFKQHGVKPNAAAHELLDAAAAQLSAQELKALAIAGLGDVADLPVDAPVPGKPASPDAVVIASYRRCVGRKAEHLLLAGMVDGFLPSLRAVDDRYTIDERAKNRAQETAFFDYLKAIPTQSLGLSLFEQDLLENAGKLNMSTTRVFMKDGDRRARIAPSLFVKQLTNPANKE